MVIQGVKKRRKPQPYKRKIPHYRFNEETFQFEPVILIDPPKPHKPTLLDILLGLQFGDEGKGKVVDVLAEYYDIIVRCQGGPNAGHTIEFDGTRLVLKNIPSGAAQGCINVIGNGCLVDAYGLKRESEMLKQNGINIDEILKIAKKAHFISPISRIMDSFYEEIRSKKDEGKKVRTTGRGIGTTISDKALRINPRIGDISDWDEFMEAYELQKQVHLKQIEAEGYSIDQFQIEGMSFSDYENLWFEGVQYIKEHFELIECEYYINAALDAGLKVLAEGAQGSLLDIDFGTYPNVTSSNTIASGMCTGLGVSPKRVGKVFGIFKAYCTRVGNGPFSTKADKETDELIRKIGGEFGAVTGRERDCGWLNLPALKYAIMLSGVTDLIMMKSDVLNGFTTVPVAIGYKHNGKIISHVPYESTKRNLEVVYEKLPGWSITNRNIPEELENYIKFIEDYVGKKIRVRLVSFGPKRKQVIWR